MNSFKDISKRLAFFFTAIAAGICLLIFQVSYDINRSLLNSDYHKGLFVKNNIYSQSQILIGASIKDFMESLKRYFPQNYQQHIEVFNMLEKTTTPEMVNYNLDSLREGLFGYFSGKNMFLPDIYLNTQADADVSKIQQASNPSQALTKIDKINLSAILLYINRNDIIEKLQMLKMGYYVFSSLPSFSLLFCLIFFFTGYLTLSTAGGLKQWLKLAFITCAALELTAGMALAAYSFGVMPYRVYPVAMSIPLQTESIISYIRDCILHVASVLTASGLFFAGLCLLVSSVARYFPRNIFNTLKLRLNIPRGTYRLSRCTLHIVLSMLLILVCLIKFYSFKKEFDSNGFPVVASKIWNSNTVTEVISADDDTIYNLEVKLLDKKSGKPVPNTQINISGKSASKDLYFYENVPTDSKGTAKAALDKGTFRLSFISDYFPVGYQLPSPFFSILRLQELQSSQ